MEITFYQIGDGRVWDTVSASFIPPEEVPAGIEPLELISAEGDSSEAYLARTLEYYNLPLGELAELSAPAIKRELAKLDALYLTPRVLAGLAHGGDSTAQAYYYAHERLAEPLRAKLARLEDPAAPAAAPSGPDD